MEDPYTPADDEVIAGSEGEDEMDSILPVPGLPNSELIDSIASGSTYGTSALRAPDTSIIDDFSSYTSTKPTRPRPRPVAKTKQLVKELPESSLAATFSSIAQEYEQIDTLTPSIADRAKMRSQSAKVPYTPAELPNDIIELNSSEDEFNLLPSVNARKKKTSIKAKTKSVTETSTVDSPQGPSTKPKKRKKPKAKPSPARIYDSPTMDGPSSSTLADSTMPIPFKLLPAEIPLAQGLPPIAVLPDSDMPPSSLSSLFGSSPPPVRKRKRSQISSLIDELEDDDPLDCMDEPEPPIPISTGPPSTFFAASSSHPPTSSMNKPAVSKAKLNDQSLPGGPINSSTSNQAAAKKTKREKKKHEMGMEVVITKPAKESKSKKIVSPETMQDMEVSADLEFSADLGDTAELQPKSTTDVEETVISSSKKRKSAKDLNGDRNSAVVGKRSKKDRQVIASSDEQDPHEGKELASENSSQNKEAETAESTNGKAPDRNEELVHESPHRNPKENVPPKAPQDIPRSSPKHSETPKPSLSSRYSIAPKTRVTPMSELIRRVNSLPGSPFNVSKPRTPSGLGTAYSPLLKSSRSALSRIAPLHPNRRTPPPPLPPPPPRKKTKKELEMEEKWEEELIEMAGGTSEWACMTDAERAELRKAKRQREMAGWED